MKLYRILPPCLLLCLALSVNAAPIAEAVNGKLRITLHDDVGVCLGAARLAVFEDGTQRIPGCWVARGDAVMIVFLDADVARVPIAAFKRPGEV